MLYKRVLSAVAGIPVFLLAVWYGDWAHFALTLLIMTFALHELNKIFGKMNLNTSFPVMLAGLLILASSALGGGHEAFGMAIMPVVGLLLLSGVFRYPAIVPGDVAAGLAGTLYIALLIFFYLIRTLDGGLTWILILLSGTWAGDTVAYFVGKKLGRIKLAPLLSPGKTLEGALGGIMGSTLGAVLVYTLYPYPGVMYKVIALGFLVGIFGILGDLFESSLKRSAGVKDTGFVIPGHGGVLDRFDSMLFTAPVVYYFVILFING